MLPLNSGRTTRRPWLRGASRDGHSVDDTFSDRCGWHTACDFVPAECGVSDGKAANAPQAERRRSIEGRVTRPRISGAVFRADHPAHTDLSRTSEASRAEPGRFNTSRFGAVYLSREPETALRELRRNNGSVEHPCALFVVGLCAERTIDLTTDKELERWGLRRDDLTSDDLSRSQKMAEAAFDSGAEAIMWPSATGRGVSLAVFLDRLTSGSSLDVIHTFELTPTVLNSVEAGVPIVTIHPLLSTFAPIAQGAADERHPEDRG